MRRLSVLFFLLIPLLSIAQLKSPEDFLGYKLGTEFSRHHEVVSYFEHLAANSAMVEFFDYGKTYERRRLTYAVVSSEENLKNLEEIRRNHLGNAGLMSSSSPSDKAIVWMSYNVHGNEASSSEAAMNTVYKLITEHRDYLQNTIVIIDPNANPDGRDRYVNWYNQVRANPYNAAQEATEHREPWPGGRPNHYLFDLNRDWMWASQVETQQRLKVYNQWMPHIHVDFHEQFINNPYYFAPGAEPYHEMLTHWQHELQHIIGKNHAKYFDEKGWLYFTRESFDLLYPSYGDTYPMFMGAIGMTYEQAGHGMAGLGIINDEDIELTLTDRIAHHTMTGLSTVEVASQNVKRINDEFHKFFKNDNLKTKSYVLKGNPDKILALTEMLERHEIQYGYAEGGTVRGHHYTTGKNGKMDADGALVIHTDQPKGKMVKVLFEPETFLSTPVTYDITAWSLPFAFGLEAVASSTKVKASGKNPDDSTNTPVPNAPGYVSKWNSMKDAQFLSDLLKNDIKVRFSEKELSFGGNEFGRGSLIITRSNNMHNPDFDKIVTEIANRHKRKLYASSTSFGDYLTDFGSQYIHLIKNKKIAVLQGEGINSLSYGTIWHFFEQQLKYPITSVNTNSLRNFNWYDYDILVLPEGHYSAVLSEEVLEEMENWISGGGNAIAFGNSIRIFAEREGFEIQKNEKDEESDNDAKDLLVPYAEREMKSSENFLTGSIFKVEMDNTHPLAFGFDKTYYSLKLGNDSYGFLKKGFNVGYIKGAAENVAGFAGEKAKESLENSIVFAKERKGKGSVTYLVDDVLFRTFWENGKLLFVNALFFN